MQDSIIVDEQQAGPAPEASRLPYPAIPNPAIVEIEYRPRRWQRWLQRIGAILERGAFIDPDMYSRDYFETWPGEGRARGGQENDVRPS